MSLGMGLRVEDDHTSARLQTRAHRIRCLATRATSEKNEATYVAEFQLFQVMSDGKLLWPWCRPTEFTCSS